MNYNPALNPALFAATYDSGPIDISGMGHYEGICFLIAMGGMALALMWTVVLIITCVIESMSHDYSDRLSMRVGMIPMAIFGCVALLALGAGIFCWIFGW